MSPYLKKNLGQPIIIKSIPGGGTTLATAAAAKAKPNGYTIIVLVTPTASLAQVLLKTEARVENFEFIYAWFNGPNDVTVDVDSPYKTFQDLAAAGKKKKLKAAVAGIGSSAHLNALLLGQYAGINAVFVPYAGGGPAATATIRGDVDFYCGLSTTSLRFVKAGQLRQIAILGPKPLEALPNTPTIYELGYKDFPNIPFVRGVAAPPGTPKAIIKFLAGAFKKSVDDPGFRAVMKKQGRPVTNLTGAEMKQIVVDGFKLAEKYVPIMKKSIKK
jgi:tripartite-type tricarboxylate transporter receptor subunit TctC